LRTKFACDFGPSGGRSDQFALRFGIIGLVGLVAAVFMHMPIYFAISVGLVGIGLMVYYFILRQ
jgi:hypothetical protein